MKRREIVPTVHPTESSEITKSVDAEPELSLQQYELLGVRGITLFLTFLRRTTQSMEFIAKRKELEAGNEADPPREPNLETILFFSQWAKTVSEICTALSNLSHVSQRKNSVLTALNPENEYYEGVPPEQMWDQSFSFLYSVVDTTELFAVLSNPVPLEETDREYRDHLITLFHHNVAGGKNLAGLMGWLEYVRDSLESKESVVDEMHYVIDNLRNFPSVLKPYSFDQEKPKVLSVKEFLSTVTDTIADLAVDFPELEITIESLAATQFSEAQLLQNIGISQNVLANIFDNCFGNACKGGASQVSIRISTEVKTIAHGKKKDQQTISILIENKGPGFSSRHKMLGKVSVQPGKYIQEVELGKSLWENPKVTGTGVALVTLRDLLKTHAGNLQAGSLMENGELSGAAVLVTLDVI